MKRLTMTLFLSLFATGLLAQSVTQSDNPCLVKRQDIQRQIDQAKAHGNERRLAGLHKALQENEANCTPESLRRERERDVSQAREKVVERERELSQAKAEGESKKKIAKRERKLAEANAELHRAQKIADER